MTYQLSHPDLNLPLEIEAHIERREQAIRAWATHHIMQQLDHLIPMEEWEVTTV